MDTNEIKKELYKQKPTANFDFIRKCVAYYHTFLNDEKIHFEIPVDDMGDADLFPEMDAKFLIRYLVNNG